jgi:hypothetical protein
MEWGSIVKLPIFFALISAAIMISSHILVFTADISWALILKIAALGILLAGLTTFLAPAMKILGKIGVTNLLKGGLAIVIIAAAIMVSSHILALGNYETFPGLDWIIGVGLSLLTFGLAAFALGFFVFGPQALIFFAGLGAILAVAGTILAVSHILSKGKYDNKGMLEWAMATSLLYMTFTPIIMALGMMGIAGAIIQFFGGDDPFEVAKGMMVQIAETIVLVSQTLKKGTYKGGPTKEWAEGISLSLGAFMPVYKMLMMNSIMSIFGGGGVGPDDFTKAILTVSDGIITAAWKFSNASVAFENPPPVEWAKGVGLAIGAFSPVYKVLAEQDGWFVDGPSVEDMRNAIISISGGIVDAAKFFAKNTASFDEGKYPSKKWGAGVGAAIGAFAPVFTAISEGSGWFTSGEEVANGLSYAIRTISRAIISSGNIFAGSDPDNWKKENVPGKAWGKGVAGAIEAFSGVFAYMTEGSGWFKSGEEVAKELASGIRTVSYAIRSSGYILGGVPEEMWKSFPSAKWGKGIGQGVNSFLDIFENLSDRGYSAASFSIYTGILEIGVKSMASTARILFENKENFTVKLDPDFIENISKNVIGFADLGLVLDQKLTYMVKKSSKSGGLLGMGETTTTKMVKKTKDMGIVDKVAYAMVKTASILYRGRKYFKSGIDPGFVKKMSRNIIDYTRLAEYLTKVQEKDSGMFDSIGSAFGFGGDPIMRIAGGMVVLAKSYDRLSESFEKFGVALEKINMEKLKEIKSLQTEQLANDLSKIKSEPEDNSFNPWGSLKSTFGFGDDKPTVGDSKKDKSKIDVFDKSKYGKDGKTIPEQLDLLIGLLTNIDQSTNTIDEFIQDASSGTISDGPGELN